ncbi:MAG: FitA-like ribbon-helix-helix domain-containing protein [Rudaea sp.]
MQPLTEWRWAVATRTIRNLDVRLKQRLRIRATQHGHVMQRALRYSNFARRCYR